ncbi:hypothetical protein C0993_002804, partial [Termitomyces sp. T159_Od127]
APPALSFDEELEALLAGEEPLVVSTAAKGKAAMIAPLVEQDLRNQEQFWQDVARESMVNMQRLALLWKQHHQQQGRLPQVVPRG